MGESSSMGNRIIIIIMKKMYIYIYIMLAMHSLAAASLPRLSATGSKWFVFQTSCYAFGV